MGMLLRLSPATRVYVARNVTDMRLGYSGLYGLVTATLEQEPQSGHLFVFCNRRRNRLKIFYWDGSGFWICAKRLEKGRFDWPERTEVSFDELTLLLGGIRLGDATAKKWYRKN
jgi:transposase